MEVTASAVVTTCVPNEAGANPITRSPTARPVTPSPTERHDAGAFEAEGRAGEAVYECLFRQQAHRPHHVAEIEACGMDLDLDLARSDRSRVPLLPGETIEPAGLTSPEHQQI